VPGMLPDSLLLSRWRSVSDKKPSDEGISPLSLLFPSWRILRDVNCPISTGIVPDKVRELKSLAALEEERLTSP
jgi:hypothetical protein